MVPWLLLMGTLAAQQAPSDSADRLAASAADIYAWQPAPDTSRVLALLADAATLYHRARDSAAEGRIYARIAAVYTDRGQVDSALRYFQRALDLQRAAGDTTGAWITAKQMRLPLAMDLLNHSPLLAPRMSVVADAQFVRDAKNVLATASDQAPLALQSSAEATRALEAELASLTIYATVRSEPSRVEVTFRRIVDSVGRELSVTTNDKIPMVPALYLFAALDPRTGAKREQRKSCATHCTVYFVFR
jgi:tetratricopeptide (TPR) repeat protein